jgi:hypothetical protein
VLQCTGLRMTINQKARKCASKVRFGTKEAARTGRAEAERQYQKAFRIYRCGSCHGYHLTTNRLGTVFMLFDVIARERENRAA